MFQVFQYIFIGNIEILLLPLLITLVKRGSSSIFIKGIEIPRSDPERRNKPGISLFFLSF